MFAQRPEVPGSPEGRIAGSEKSVGVVAVNEVVQPAPGELAVAHEVHAADD